MPTPNYATVINQINTFIVANGNNEITANVLNPILKIITDFANNTIGNLSTLTTDESDNIVNALNSLKANINNAGSNAVKMFTGFDNPNLIPPPSFNFADFYMQLSNLDNLPVDLWQWDGFEWVPLGTTFDDLSTKLDKDGYTGTAQTLSDEITTKTSKTYVDAQDADTLDAANTYTDNKVVGIYKFKGSVANYAALPTTGNTVGDVWNLLDTDMNYAWTGTVWDSLGTTVDISTKLDKGTYTGNAGDLKQLIDDIYQPNVLISSVQPTRAVNKFTYPALSYDALINKVRYKNPIKFETTIAEAAENFKRTDLVYITTGGVMGIKVGAESTTVSVRPELTANEVAVSFINVFGSVIEAPVPVDNRVSIQNSIGQHQFYMEDILRVRGVDFDAPTKQIVISPLSPNTAFVDGTLGNDATAELENSKKPFKTIDGVFARYSSDQPATSFVRLYLVNAAVYPWNNKIYNISFEIYSDKAAVVDMSGASTGSIFININVQLKYTMFLNMPLGTLRNNKLTAGGTFGNEDFSSVINLRAINWTSGGFVFATNEGVTFLNLSELTLRGILIGYPGTARTPINLAKLDIVGKINSPYGVTVKELTVTGDAPFSNNEEWNIGNIFGTLNFTYTHNQNIKVKFNDSVITGGINFAGNDQGNIVFSGNIKSTTITGSIGANRSDRIGSMTWTDLTIQDLKSTGIKFAGGYINLKLINCYINQTVGNWLFQSISKTLGSCSYRVEKSTLRQSTAGTLLNLDNNNLITSIDIGGFESNCLSITNIKDSPITFDLISFKDKKKEMVIRSKIDLIDRVLDSEMNYIIDGVLELTATESIIVPIGGLSISGYGFDVSAIKATQPNSIIYKSAVGGCGNLFIQNLSHEASGGGSKVFDLTNAGAPTGGADAIELGVVNFDNCDSIGDVRNFRQGLWDNIGVFGCKDGITFEGVWSGGFRADLVIVRNFGTAGIGGTLFKKGTGLLFKSRFLTDINVDFKDAGNLSDFDSTSFESPKLYQVKAAQVTRNKVLDDTQNYTGSLNAFSPECDWSGNNGMKNSNIHPYGISTDKLLVFPNDADAGTGGVSIGEVYIEATTGYFKTKLT